jgi:hypothetical protein
MLFLSERTAFFVLKKKKLERQKLELLLSRRVNCLFLTCCYSSQTASWLAQNHVAADAQNNCLSMAKNSGDFYTAFFKKQIFFWLIKIETKIFKWIIDWSIDLLGHLTSMKNEFGLCTNLFSLHFLFSSSRDGFNKSLASF